MGWLAHGMAHGGPHRKVHVTPREPLIYIAVAVLVVIVAVIASLVPARRVTEMAPATVLRAE